MKVIYKAFLTSQNIIKDMKESLQRACFSPLEGLLECLYILASDYLIYFGVWMSYIFWPFYKLL